MSVKEKTKKELEQRVEKLENIIAKEGVGSEYLQKAERIQRNLNLALLLGTSAAVLGITAWAFYKISDD
ncbi:MAG: hypothetical protein R6V27_11400 [Balneolaceae bacterium]